MKTLNVFDVLFSKSKNSKYDEAMESLSRVETIISSISVSIPDIASEEIEIFKNKWVEIKNPVGQGVHAMGLDIEGDYKSLLVHYQKNSYTAKHFHSNEYETILILDGSALDKSTGMTLNKGEFYVIPKNAIHEIVTTDEECYMYVMFSQSKHHLKLSDSAKKKAKAMMGKHSFKATK